LRNQSFFGQVQGKRVRPGRRPTVLILFSITNLGRRTIHRVAHLHSKHKFSDEIRTYITIRIRHTHILFISMGKTLLLLLLLLRARITALYERSARVRYIFSPLMGRINYSGDGFAVQSFSATRSGSACTRVHTTMCNYFGKRIAVVPGSIRSRGPGAAAPSYAHVRRHKRDAKNARACKNTATRAHTRHVGGPLFCPIFRNISRVHRIRSALALHLYRAFVFVSFDF